MVLPLPLLVFAWRKPNRQKIAFVVVGLSAALLLVASVPDARHILLGRNYSHRLHASIEVNMLLAATLGLYLAITRRWLAAIAAAMLLWVWFWVDVMNSVV
jgi:hypothetical protein